MTMEPDTPAFQPIRDDEALDGNAAAACWPWCSAGI